MKYLFVAFLVLVSTAIPAQNKETCRVALVQAHLAWGNVEANLDAFQKRVEQCKDCDVIVFPELFVSGKVVSLREKGSWYFIGRDIVLPLIFVMISASRIGAGMTTGMIQLSTSPTGRSRAVTIGTVFFVNVPLRTGRISLPSTVPEPILPVSSMQATLVYLLPKEKRQQNVKPTKMIYGLSDCDCRLVFYFHTLFPIVYRYRI